MIATDKWDLRFLGLARLVAGWSKDPSTSVGCVVVDPRHRVLSLGFNGPPRGASDDRLEDREEKLRHIIHAEENALLFARGSVEEATAYVFPAPPCARCASKLIQAGIARVVAVAPTPEFEARWEKDLELSKLLFLECGVDYDLFELPEL